jgi:hypothetical protein
VVVVVVDDDEVWVATAAASEPLLLRDAKRMVPELERKGPEVTVGSRSTAPDDEIVRDCSDTAGLTGLGPRVAMVADRDRVFLSASLFAASTDAAVDTVLMGDATPFPNRTPVRTCGSESCLGRGTDDVPFDGTTSRLGLAGGGCCCCSGLMFGLAGER